MEKFKTLNNSVCKDIIRNAVGGCHRAVYMLIYNYHDAFTDDLFVKLYNLCYEFCPMSLELFKTLPLEVQNWYNVLWQRA